MNIDELAQVYCLQWRPDGSVILKILKMTFSARKYSTHFPVSFHQKSPSWNPFAFLFMIAVHTHKVGFPSKVKPAGATSGKSDASSLHDVHSSERTKFWGMQELFLEQIHVSERMNQRERDRNSPSPHEANFTLTGTVWLS